MPSPTLPDDKGATIADVLNRAADRLSKPDAWTQGWFAETKSRRRTFASDERAACWCVLGAMMAELNSPYASDIPDGVAACLGFQDLLSLSQWNDAPGRTQAEVVETLRQAAAKALEQGK